MTMDRGAGPYQRTEFHFNRLLDYRPLDRLERLTDTGRAELLSEILQKSPSQETWLDLYELFALWPDNDAKLTSLDVAERELARWDDRVRFADSSSGVLYSGGRLAWVARLVTSMEIYRREEHADGELSAIVSSEYATRLTRLSIVRSEVSTRAWKAMVESPNLTNLRHLHVTNIVVTADGIRQLLLSSGMPRLQCLKLIEVGLKREALDAVRSSIRFSSLQQIDFSRNLLRDDGAVLLAEAPWLQRIERLILRRNFIREPAMRALLSSPYIDRLKQMDLSENEVSDSDRTALQRLADAKRIELTV